ncbi:MAG: (d)CMP kinase [Rhodospirillales bacterium]|nr:(d)CMP kinase [Rhodospirillales bacterium]
MPRSEPAPLVIAVDGPAAAGKGTLARRLAAHYGLRHLDTGALYRATALRLLRTNGDPAQQAEAADAARDVTAFDLDDPALRGEEVGQAASVVAVHGAVRVALLDYQRTFAAEPPGAVLDGRDIGTVVCPDAQVKLYLEATPEVRAERRLCELRSRGVESIESSVLEEIITRDVRDSRRSAAPLKPAADASRIDTTDLGPDEVFERAVAVVDTRLSSA